jgi:hypothetical protein
MEIGASVKTTMLRGQTVFKDGNVVGPARGQYLRRPMLR